MAKWLGAEQTKHDGDLTVECLKGLDNTQSVEKVAEFFSHISQEYSPLDMNELPAYLPAPELLKVQESDVADKIYNLKIRKSTQLTDLPSKVRKAFSSELATPLTDIINCCFEKHYYSKLWKHEWVVPAPKVNQPKQLKDLRKISLTSEYSEIQ